MSQMYIYQFNKAHGLDPKYVKRITQEKFQIMTKCPSFVLPDLKLVTEQADSLWAGSFMKKNGPSKFCWFKIRNQYFISGINFEIKDISFVLAGRQSPPNFYDYDMLIKHEKEKEHKLKNKIYDVPYYWYYHGDNQALKEIKNALDKKDFKTFIMVAKKWNCKKQPDGKTWVYCPDTARVYDANDNKIGEVNVFTESGFKKITYNEYECG